MRKGTITMNENENAEMPVIETMNEVEAAETVEITPVEATVVEVVELAPAPMSDPDDGTMDMGAEVGSIPTVDPEAFVSYGNILPEDFE